MYGSFSSLMFLTGVLFNRFAETFDLNEPDPVAHKHTPYVVILIKMAEEWTKAHGGSLPSTREEKKEFKVWLVTILFVRFLWLSINVIYLWPWTF